MKKIRAVLVGAGSRGMDVYAAYALEHPDEIEFVAVAEPDPQKNAQFCKLHHVAPENSFTDYRPLFEKGKLADCALICTQDQMHVQPTLMALQKGYHVLLEKPMAITRQDCQTLVDAAQAADRHLMVCHVLRYTQFYSLIKQIIQQKQLGDLVAIHQHEDIANWHFAHSYVRGNWAIAAQAAPMILAKCCHDLDILRFLADAECEQIASVGSLQHFRSQNAPDGAPLRCLDGCVHRRDCLYYAPDQYLTGDTDWPTAVISADKSHSARLQALQTGPYGRCVYRCDNDVCDNQMVQMRFTNGVNASLTVSAFTPTMTRSIVVYGTKGRLSGNLDTNTIRIEALGTGRSETIVLGADVDRLGHGGGDIRLMRDFVDLVSGRRAQSKTLGQDALASHIMAFAAEQARVEQTVVRLG